MNLNILTAMCFITCTGHVSPVSADSTDSDATHLFTPYALFSTDIFSNVSGGQDTGTSVFGLLEVGVDADLSEMTDLSGFSAHVSGLLAGGEDPSLNVGDFNTLSSLAAPDGLFFYEAWLQKHFLDERIRLKLGLTTVDADFMVSEYAGTFINSGFGILPTFSGNTAIPTFPLAGLGVLAQYSFTGSSYLQLAVYDGDAGADDEHGLDYDFGSDEGAAIVYEIGTKLVNQRGLNGSYKFGGLYHTGEFTDFRDGSTLDDNYNFYVVIDQVLINQTAGDPRLAGFLRASYSPEKERNTVNYYVETGLNLFSPFPGRDEDIFGIGLSLTDFSEDFVRDSRLTERHVNESESVLEIFYQAQITPWLVVKPDLQFIVDPLFSEDDAIVLGARIEMSL